MSDLPLALQAREMALRSNREQDQSNMQSLTGITGILSKLKEQQDAMNINGVLSSPEFQALAPEKQITKLAQMPGGMQVAGQFVALQQHLAGVKQAGNVENFRNDVLSGKFNTPGAPAEPAHTLPPDIAGPSNPAIPARAPGLDQNAMLRAAIGASPDPIKAMAELRAENKPVPIGVSGMLIPDGQGGYRTIPGHPKPMVEHNYPVAGDKVQPHISLDNGVTWNPIPGSVAGPKFARQVAPIINMGGADKYGNIQPDGKGGYVGMNKTNGRMEKIPMAEGTEAPGQYTKEALGDMAWEKLLFGIDPKGLGNMASAQRAVVSNERSRIGRELGLTSSEIAMLPQDNKIKNKAVDKLTTWGAFIDKSSDQLTKTIDIAIDYAKKMDPMQLQVINRAIVSGKKEFNDPIANAYALQVNSIRQEYGRMMSGPTSNAMLPVEAMKKGDSLISMGLNLEGWQEMKNAILRDAAATRSSVQDQISGLRSSIGTPGRRASDNAAPDPAVDSLLEKYK